MMRKIVSLMAILATLFMFAGCDTNSKSTTVNVQPATPAPTPVVPDDSYNQGDEGPTMVSGSIRPHFDADGGYVTIQASWKANGNIDANSLVISHSENGELRDEDTPSVFTNGSLSKIDEEIYIYPNDTGKSIVHIFKLTYFTMDGVGRSQTWSVKQAPQGDTNATAVIPKVIF